MDFETKEAALFLAELYRMGDGNPETQVSMYDVGDVLGMDRAVAGAVAEDLIVQGLAELVSLSGGISITIDGLKALSVESSADEAGQTCVLGSGLLLTETEHRAVSGIIDELRTSCFNHKTYDQLEDIVFDVKTVEMQLFSPKPKTAVIRELLRSLAVTTNALGMGDISQKLNLMVSS
jgi:hypothetical protein